MQSWTNYQLRFKTGSWCITEYDLPKSDDYLLHNKIESLLNFSIDWFYSYKTLKLKPLKPHYIHVYKVFG